MTEPKPPLINEQCAVYEYKCDLFDAGYVGYTCRHINEHKHSVIGKHLRNLHNLRNKDLRDQFTILKKCRRKLDCFFYKMLFIKNKKPTLNTQSDQLKQNFLFDSSSAQRLKFYFLLFIICTETFTRTFHYIMNSPKAFLFEVENDGMEPSKRFSFISLFFILK